MCAKWWVPTASCEAHREAHSGAAALRLHAGQGGIVQGDYQVARGAGACVEVGHCGGWNGWAGRQASCLYDGSRREGLCEAGKGCRTATRRPPSRRPPPLPAPELAAGKPTSRRAPSPSGSRTPGSVSSTTPALRAWRHLMVSVQGWVAGPMRAQGSRRPGSRRPRGRQRALDPTPRLACHCSVVKKVVCVSAIGQRKGGGLPALPSLRGGKSAGGRQRGS